MMWFRLVVGLAAVLILLLFVVVANVYKVAVKAERTYQAELVVMTAIEKYVKENSRWPNRWEDLSGVNVDNGFIDWPSDIDNVKELVDVNFELDICELRNEDFDLNKVFQSPCRKKNHFDAAISNLKKIADKNQNKVPSTNGRRVKKVRRLVEPTNSDSK